MFRKAVYERWHQLTRASKDSLSDVRDKAVLSLLLLACYSLNLMMRLSKLCTSRMEQSTPDFWFSKTSQKRSLTEFIIEGDCVWECQGKCKNCEEVHRGHCSKPATLKNKVENPQPQRNTHQDQTTEAKRKFSFNCIFCFTALLLAYRSREPGTLRQNK